MEEKKFIIGENLLKALLVYLAKQPLEQSVQLWDALRRLAPNEPAKKDGEEEKGAD